MQSAYIKVDPDAWDPADPTRHTRDLKYYVFNHALTAESWNGFEGIKPVFHSFNGKYIGSTCAPDYHGQLATKYRFTPPDSAVWSTGDEFGVSAHEVSCWLGLRLQHRDLSQQEWLDFVEVRAQLTRPPPKHADLHSSVLSSCSWRALAWPPAFGPMFLKPGSQDGPWRFDTRRPGGPSHQFA